MLLHDNHVQPVCTFLSCIFLLNLIFKSTVYCHAHFYILYFVLYILFFTYFILCIFPLCLYSIIFALSMERTWLTFHCWLYILYIIVYVTNTNLESWMIGISFPQHWDSNKWIIFGIWVCTVPSTKIAITEFNNEMPLTENWVFNLVILHYWHTIFLFWYCAVALTICVVKSAI